MNEETLKNSIERIFDENLAYYAELDGESDRATAILAVARFEDKLREAIAKQFVELNRKLEIRIFCGYGPLSTLAGKLDIAYALGMYDQKTLENLRSIKKIRNKFAHSPKPVQFVENDIADMCSTLCVEYDPERDSPRYQFLFYLQQMERKILEEYL